MNKSKISLMGEAIIDLIEEWELARVSTFVRKPISYALYKTWQKWDKKEQAREQHNE